MKTLKDINDGHIVERVENGSIADQIGLIKGDRIVSFNNQPFIDVIDYVYFCSKKKIKIM